MKTTSLLLAAIAGLAILLSPARAENPAPPALSPDVQALLGELSKLGAGGNGKEDPQIDVQALFGMLLKVIPAAAAQGGGAPKAAEDAQVQELLTQLTELVKAVTKMVADDAPAPAAAPDPAAATANPAATASTAVTPESKPAPAPGANARPGALTTGSLNSGSLTPSSSLNGRGTAGGTPKMTDSEWRSLFPASNDRK